MLKLAWLGPPVAELDGVQIHFETRKIAALLAYLSLNPLGSPREKLAALLWPEFDQTHAMANLRRALGSLTRALPAGYLEASRESVRWSENPPVEMDVLKFREMIQTVRVHEHESDPDDSNHGLRACQACLNRLETACDLHRGDFLDGLNLPDAPSFDEWQYLTRAELTRELAWALEHLAGGLVRQAPAGQLTPGLPAWEKAASVARRWLSLDRLEVGPHLALVRIYAQAGQRSLAQRQVEEYTRIFTEEFGDAPDAETSERFQQALNLGQPNRVGSKSPVGGPSAAAPVLLKTKLYLPKVKPNRVSRLRLLETLNGVGEHKLSLVSAPAGFGKTSLLAEWAAQTELLVSWLSLDAGDNDPHRFLSYVCAALESVQEGLGDNAMTLLESSQPVAPQAITTVLLKDLEPVTELLVLALDDYQFINSQPVHEIVSYLLERSAPNLHLLIAARADPPLPLARFRAAGELLEVRTDDLRFTVEECVAFFNQAMGLDISPADIQALAGKTEGWAVGLQMAAISLRGAPDRAQFIQTFSGSHRYILDYLIQEVLDRQPAHVRDFLLKTSILARLCSGLCEAVVGPGLEPAAATLDYLERSNLFLIPLDQERHWYRYHHLFADLLSVQLQRFQPSEIQALHLRASAWYEQNSQIEAAVEHALAVGDFERVGDLVELDAQMLGSHTDFSLMKRWLDRLPPEIILRRAWIAITQGWVWLLAGNQQALSDLMDQAEANYDTLWSHSYSETTRQTILANLKCLRGYMAFYAGNVLRCIELSREALQVISPGEGPLRVRLLIQSGEAHQVIQDLPSSCGFFEQAIELSIRWRDFYSTTIALMRLYRSLRLLGKVAQAETITQRIIRDLSEAQQMQTLIAAKPALCWGDLLRERGHKDEARKWLEQGLQYSRQYDIPFDIITAMVYNVKWFYSEGLWDPANQLADEGLQLIQDCYIPPPIAFSLMLWRSKVLLEQGDFQAVLAWLESISPLLQRGSSHLAEEAQMVQARLYQLQGKHSQALALLEPVVLGAEASGRIGNLIPLLLLQATSLDAQCQSEAALEQVGKCLRLAQPERYLMTFRDEGPQVEKLIRTLRARELPQPIQAYADEILQIFTARSTLTV